MGRNVIRLNLRKIVFWLHLAVGIAAGLVILMMAATGILLTFEKPALSWAEKEAYAITPPPGTQRLGLESLVNLVAASVPELTPESITMRSESTRPAAVGFGKTKTVFIHPYTGRILGEGSKARGFFHFVEDLHRRLALGPVGKNITGLAASAFLILLLSGLYLWLPRERWKRKVLKSAALPSFKLRGKAREWNWHNAFGLWCSPFLVIVTLTGLVMAYPWATNLLYRVTGSELPPPRNAAERRENSPGKKDKSPASWSSEGLDQLWDKALPQIEGWQSITVRIPSSPQAPVIFLADLGDGSRPDKRSQLTFNSRSGEVIRRESFQTYNLGRKLRMWTKFIHTGEAGGWPGQLLAGLASCGAVVLVWTGFSLSLRRLLASRSQRRRPTL